jgi:hypothetical protein
MSERAPDSRTGLDVPTPRACRCAFAKLAVVCDEGLASSDLRESPEPDGPGLVPDRPEGDEHDAMDGIGEVAMPPRPNSCSIV